MKKFIYSAVVLSALFLGGQAFAACVTPSPENPTYTVYLKNNTSGSKAYPIGVSSSTTGTCEVCSAPHTVYIGEPGKIVVQCKKSSDQANVVLTLQFLMGHDNQTCGNLTLSAWNIPGSGDYGITSSLSDQNTNTGFCGPNYFTWVTGPSPTSTYYDNQQTVIISTKEAEKK